MPLHLSGGMAVTSLGSEDNALPGARGRERNLEVRHCFRRELAEVRQHAGSRHAIGAAPVALHELNVAVNLAVTLGCDGSQVHSSSVSTPILDR